MEGRWSSQGRARRMLLLFLLLLLLGSPSRGAVMSIDLGSEWLKVAVVNPRPGHSPIAVAINEMSKRKSPALVAFSNGERLLGESAAGISARYPDRVYSAVRDMIGKPVEQVRDFLRNNYLPFDVVEDERGAASIRIHDQEALFTVEELLAMILRYAVDLGEAHVKGVIKDAVVTVPPYFGQAERRAVLTAANFAGINVLSLINEHSGAALQYGIDKDFENETRHVVFYDMGANSVFAAMVSFTSYSSKDKGKAVNHNQFQVKGVRWDAALGGQTMEMRLVEYFADEFNSQVGGGLDVRKFPKAMAKLKKQVKRTKEILSANVDAPLSVEGLHDDRDFRSSITREKFEKLCSDLWDRALVPLRQVLADTGLSALDVYAVEIIGGATRVPKLQAVLSEFLGKKELDRHLDADEAIVLGAALQAANISDGFKLNRKLGMIDGAPYGMVLRLESPSGAPFESHDNAGLGADQLFLVPRLLKKVPSKVYRSFKNVKEDFTATICYDPAGPLPPGIPAWEISSFQIEGVTDAVSRYASHNLSAPIKTTLHFSLSRSGILSLDRAETVVEISEWYDVPLQNSSQDSNQTSTLETTEQQPEPGKSDRVTEGTDKGSEVGGQEQPSDAVGEKVVTTQKLRKRTIRIPLKIKDVTSGASKSLSGEVSLKANQRIAELNKKDAEKRETAEAKNSLEAYIYATKDKLESVEGIGKVTTQTQLDSFKGDLQEAEDWLYMDGEDASAVEFKNRLASLEKTGNSIFFRLDELKARPLVLQYAKQYFTELKEILEGWEKDKPWISEANKNEITKEWTAFEKWLDEKESRQREIAGHEDPAFATNEVFARIGLLKEKVAKANRTPKPKPKVIETVIDDPANSPDGVDSQPKDLASEDQSEISAEATHDEL